MRVTELTDLLPIILVAVFLWLLGLSYFFYRLYAHYSRIAKRANSGDLVAAIDALLKKEVENSSKLEHIKKDLYALSEKSVYPLQKVGLVRFNPFNENGGDQSFSLCLLDGNKDGFVLTTLHTRDRTRLYTKPIIKGESKYDLSAEEAKALKEAEKTK